MFFVQELLQERYDVVLLAPTLIWWGVVSAALVVVVHTLSRFRKIRGAKRLATEDLLYEAEKNVGGRWRQFSPLWMWILVLGLLALGLEFGEPAKVTETQHEAARFVLALDKSLSTTAVKEEGGQTALDDIKSKALAIVESAREGDEIALVIFADEAVLAIEPTADKERLRQVILGLQPEIATDLGGALLEMYNMVRLSDEEAHGILISDGAASTDASVGLALERLNSVNVSVSTIQVGSLGGFTIDDDGLRRTFAARPELMESIAAATVGVHVPNDDDSELRKVYTDLERTVTIETDEEAVHYPLYVGLFLVTLGVVVALMRRRLFG